MIALRTCVYKDDRRWLLWISTVHITSDVRHGRHASHMKYRIEIVQEVSMFQWSLTSRMIFNGNRPTPSRPNGTVVSSLSMSVCQLIKLWLDDSFMCWYNKWLLNKFSSLSNPAYITLIDDPLSWASFLAIESVFHDQNMDKTNKIDLNMVSNSQRTDKNIDMKNNWILSLFWLSDD